MGNTSSEEKKEQLILRKPKTGTASDFYWGCRNGDLDLVKTIFASSNMIEINNLEPNGSTGLHAAAYNGEFDVVQFLLQNGVMRHRQNRYGLTAYEEAGDDRMRSLFDRPSILPRFAADTSENTRYNLFSIDEEEDEGNDFADGVSEDAVIPGIQASFNLMKYLISSPVLKPLSTRFLSGVAGSDRVSNDKEVTRALQQVIDTCVTSSHPEYAKACELIAKYNRSGRVEHLLRLYSLETPFYRQVERGKDIDGLVFPVFSRLDTLKKRAFHGESYRGLTMTEKDLRGYRWASKSKSRVLSTETFFSSSTEKNVADSFVLNMSKDHIGVLMVFHFEQICDTAIELFRLSDDLPSISDFEGEREVLILPLTLFHVTKIETDISTGRHTIHLTNLPLKGGLFSLLKVCWNNRQNLNWSLQ